MRGHAFPSSFVVNISYFLFLLHVVGMPKRWVFSLYIYYYYNNNIIYNLKCTVKDIRNKKCGFPQYYCGGSLFSTLKIMLRN